LHSRQQHVYALAFREELPNHIDIAEVSKIARSEKHAKCHGGGHGTQGIAILAAEFRVDDVPSYMSR